jgi:hypothetical protein
VKLTVIKSMAIMACALIGQTVHRGRLRLFHQSDALSLFEALTAPRTACNVPIVGTKTKQKLIFTSFKIKLSLYFTGKDNFIKYPENLPPKGDGKGGEPASFGDADVNGFSVDRSIVSTSPRQTKLFL